MLERKLIEQLSKEMVKYDELEDFIQDYGWEDWMDEYCKDDEPTEYEISQIDAEFDDPWEESRELKKEYSQIKLWRERAGLSQAQMSAKLDIPKRTIEDWETYKSFAPMYVVKLLVEKLMTITKDTYESKMRKYAAQQKSDEEGKRPVVTWATISLGRDCEWVEVKSSMVEAVADAEEGEEVACILINENGDIWYADKDGNIASDHEYFEV